MRVRLLTSSATGREISDGESLQILKFNIEQPTLNIQQPIGEKSDGEGDGDGGAVAEAGLDFDLAAVGFDDAGDDGEAEAGAFGFGGGEDGGEGAAALFFGHAFAGVLEVHKYCARVWRRCRAGSAR